jgi:branched-chain amino acid transport system permease protein
MDILVVQVLNSLFFASVLFQLASGLTLVYGVMRIVNLAHGNLYALGAYVTGWLLGLAVGRVSGAPLFLLLIGGAAAVAVFGALLEPVLLRRLYSRAEEYQLLVTFGLLLILEDSMRFLWGPHPLTSDALPDLLGSARFLGAIYPNYNLFVIAVGAVAAVSLWVFVYRTKFGIILRATSQDRRMASALGVDVNRVYVQAFALGCFMAGLAGAVVMPIYGAVLGMGIDALVLAFIVVVIGGLGSLQGVVAGALIVGTVRTVGITYFPEVELAILYLIGATVLLVRPAGLFGKA